eukprot:191111-Rhodomonas_salina.1
MLRARYAVCGTDIRYAATLAVCGVRAEIGHAARLRAVLRQGIWESGKPERGGSTQGDRRDAGY